MWELPRDAEHYNSEGRLSQQITIRSIGIGDLNARARRPALKGIAKQLLSKFILSLATVASIGAMSTAASAETRWSRHHPRQHEVLRREHRQISRINHERREGDLTVAQARSLRASDRSIAMQDRADARANGGYITKAQQQNLKAEENAQSRAIGH